MKEKSIGIRLKGKLLSVFLILGFSITLVGTAYGRYQQTTSKELSFSIREAAQFSIQTGEWKETDAGRRLEITVSEKEKQECSFKIRLVSTIGIEMDQATVSLITRNTKGTERVFQSKVREIESESELYTGMGPGYEYSFYDAASNELVWSLNGDGTSTQSFVIEVSGAKQDNLMEITVIETQQES